MKRIVEKDKMIILDLKNVEKTQIEDVGEENA